MIRILLVVTMVACSSIAYAESKECKHGYVPRGKSWAPSGTDVSFTGLASICNDGSGTCKRVAIYNYSTTNACIVRVNSPGVTFGKCLPAAASVAVPSVVDFSEWVADSTRISSIYASTSGSDPCPSGVTVGACQLEVVGCP